jgi:predicted PurR-regulated permease PerM
LVAITSGGVGLGLLVIAVYVIIQQFENHLIYPLVVTKVVGVPPLLVILALLIGGKLAGFLGILLSAPLAAIVQEVVSDLEARRARIRAAAEGTSQ